MESDTIHTITNPASQEQINYSTNNNYKTNNNYIQNHHACSTSHNQSSLKHLENKSSQVAEDISMQDFDINLTQQSAQAIQIEAIIRNPPITFPPLLI